MCTYTKHDNSCYETNTTPYLLKHGKTDAEGFNDVVDKAYEIIEKVINVVFDKEFDSFKKISKFMFTDSDMNNDYDEVVNDIAELMANAIFGDISDAILQ